MKNALLLTVAALALTAPAAFAADAAPTTTTTTTTEAPAADAPHKGGHNMMLEKIDTDKDGTISKGEFMKFHEDRFAELDANSDGKITKDEFAAAKQKWDSMKHGMRSKKGAEGSSESKPK